MLTQALINRSALEKAFHRRINAKIIQTEVKVLKKKFNTATLATVGSLIVAACILIILQIQLVLFANDIVMPVILLCLVVVVGGVFALDYYFVRSRGEVSLVGHLGDDKVWEQKLKELQRENTREYNHIKKAFESILSVDSKFILNAFILRHYITSLKGEELELQAERLYQLLLLISSKKNLDLQKHLEEHEEEPKLRELLTPFLERFKQRLASLAKQEPLPYYFKNNITLSIEALDSFTNPLTREKKVKS